MKEGKPVFFDATGKRWRKYRNIAFAGFFVATVLFGGLYWSIIHAESFATLPLPDTTPSTVHPISTQTTTPNPTVKPFVPRSIVAPKSTSMSEGVRWDFTAFFVNWDDNSLFAYKEHIDVIDVLVAEWLHLGSPEGDILEDDPNRSAEVIRYRDSFKPNLPIMALVNNYNSDGDFWDNTMLTNMLQSSDSRAKNIDLILTYVQTNNLQGVNIDYENLDPESYQNYVTFLSEISSAFHAAGLQVSVDIPAVDPMFRLADIEASVDRIILMVYDEHTLEDTAGAVASMRFVTESVESRLREVKTPDIITVALGNYGYQWMSAPVAAPIVRRTPSPQVGALDPIDPSVVLPKLSTNAVALESADSPTQFSNRSISFSEAMHLARLAGTLPQYDSTTLNPSFSFQNETGSRFSVWFLDAVTWYNSLHTMQKSGIKSVALWRLGGEDPRLWSALGESTPEEVRDAFVTVGSGYDVEYQGYGEVLRVKDTSESGRSDIGFNSDGFITAAAYTQIPRPYVVSRYGGTDDKVVVLTFDDGPNREFTPQILKILRQFGVKATFFVIGMYANAEPGIVRDIYNDGHEIGSHTFTHPDISKISPEQLSVEFELTERVIESITGRRMTLFRPPYAEDIEPETPKHIDSLVWAGEHGYTTVGLYVDPLDWASRSSDDVARQVIDEIRSNVGHVVLLHDGGSNRDATVAALPIIIDTLQKEGYRFETVGEYLSKTRDDTMPPVDGRIGHFWQWWNFVVFMVFSFLLWFSSGLFYWGTIIGVARLIWIIVLVFIESFVRGRKPVSVETQEMLASIIVPCYNEELVVARTIDSLLHSSYKNFEILVVDDGSKDATWDILRRNYEQNPQVRLFTKSNGGKTNAMNFGIEEARGEVIITVDADTIFTTGTLATLVSHFADPQIGAVAGNVKVGNRINFLTCFQALEYIISQNFDKKAFSFLNAITVVPGAIGAWRRSIIGAIGGLSHDTLAEDADMTVSVVSLGYKVVYEPNAIAYTEAPDTVRGFIQQRVRWMYGTFQVLWKYRKLLLRPKYGALGCFALPNIFVFNIIFPLLAPLIDGVFFLSLAWGLFQYSHHPAGAPITYVLQDMIWFYIAFVVVDFIVAVVAFTLERRESWWLLLLVYPQRYFYRPLMLLVVLRVVYLAIKGVWVNWKSVERKATVTI